MGCKFTEMNKPSTCKYTLVSLHASMLHNTASPVSIFIRFDEKTPVCRYVPQLKLSESVRKYEMDRRQARQHLIKKRSKI